MAQPGMLIERPRRQITHRALVAVQLSKAAVSFFFQSGRRS
jgi:hypothetical protein